MRLISGVASELALNPTYRKRPAPSVCMPLVASENITKSSRSPGNSAAAATPNYLDIRTPSIARIALYIAGVIADPRSCVCRLTTE